MKRIRKFVKENYIIIIPFFATFFLYFVNAIVNKIYPFGNETFVYSDMSEQYVIYFGYLKDAFLSGNNLFSSFSFSLGQNFYGIFTYFCASPLNIIFLLSTKSNIPTFILFLVTIKLSLASMNMAILLKHKLRSNLSIFVFSIIYGLMSYNLTYSVNIMWLDPVYLLPLIILGLEKVFSDKPFLYIFSLTLAMCSNYYIAFPVCIFLVIYFIYYHLLDKKDLKKHLYSFIKYSLIAALLSSVILIPTIFNMLDGKFEIAESDFSFVILYNPMLLIYRFFIGDYKNLLDDIPIISSSLLVFACIITYLFNKNITIKDKIYTFLTLSLLLGITLLLCTDTIMHCFRLPNQFPYRYAFIISFFMILMSSKNFDNFKVNKKNVLIYVLFGFIIYKYLTIYIGFKTIASSLLLLIYLFGIMIFKDKKLLSLFIIPFIVGELFINVSSSFNWLTRFTFEEYSENYKYMNEISALKPKQDEFYRISALTSATLNDALTYGYYGITSFSPTMSVNSNRLLKDYLGEPLNPSYAVEYLAITDFSDALLNIKYKYRYDDNGFEVIENKNVFPVMFKLTNNDRFKESESKIENQNSLYKYLSNSDDDLFKLIDNYEVRGCELIDGYLVKSIEEFGYCDFVPIDKSKRTYFEIDSNSFAISPIIDGITTSENYGYHIISELRNYLRVNLSKSKVKVEYVASYEFDEEKLEALNEVLNNNKVNITFHNQSKIEGNISNDLDDQIMFTSIPYDDGWHVEINGKEVRTFKNLDSLLAFDLPKGESNIVLYFIPKGYLIGLAISLATFDILVALYIRKNKENY